MSYPTQIRCAGTHRVATTFLLLTLALLFASAPALGQQTYVSRYDLFAGYTFLDSPRVSLFENGFHFQVGVRPKTWCSLGFDYSISGGDLTLTPNLLTTAWQQQLGGLLQQLGASGATPCRIHRGGTLQFHDPNLCGRTTTCVPSLPEGNPLCSAFDWSDS